MGYWLGLFLLAEGCLVLHGISHLGHAASFRSCAVTSPEGEPSDGRRGLPAVVTCRGEGNAHCQE